MAGEKIKVINVITDSNIGGAGYLLYNNLKHSDRDVFEHVIILPQNSLLRAKLEPLGFRIIEVGGMAETTFSFGAVKKLKRVFKVEKPNIVHAHAALSARVAARLARIPVIYTRHCAFDLPKRQKTWLMRLIQGTINNALSDLIIAVSPAAADNLEETGVNMKKVRVIFNGADPLDPLTDDEKIEARKLFGVKEGDFVCTILARLTPVKGHEYIIEAARILGDDSLRILIAGTGEIEAQLKQQAQGLNSVVFVGFINEPRTVLGISDVQLNASYGTETTSLALIEGMSLGLPTIASNHGGTPWVVETGANGLLIEKKSAEAFVAAIKELKGNADMMKQLSVGALERYERFRASRMSAEVDEVYKDVYAGTRTKAAR